MKLNYWFSTIVSDTRVLLKAIISSIGGPDDVNRPILTGDDGKLDPSLISDSTLFAEVFESVGNNSLVTVIADGGSFKVVPANARKLNRDADGFVLVGGSVGSKVLVYKSGIINGFSNLAVNKYYYLSNTDGEVINNIDDFRFGDRIQVVAKALSEDSLFFKCADSWMIK